MWDTGKDHHLTTLAHDVITPAAFNDEALSDYNVANAWLRTYEQRSVETLRAYQKEAKRFLRWLEYRKFTIRTLTKEAATEYIAFLTAPPGDWLISPATGADGDSSSYYKLLQGGLSPQSINYTIRVLKLFFSWLREDGYVQKNVFKLVGRSSAVVETTQERYLDLPAWQWLWQQIITKEKATLADGIKEIDRRKASRLRWLFALLYHTGIRCQEAARATMGDIRTKNGKWYLHVIGKGNKQRLISINSELRKELRLYRRSNPAFFTTDYPTPGETAPLLHPFRVRKNQQNLTTRMISEIVRETVDEIVTYCEEPHIKDQVERMTLHWMRHTNGTHRIMAGASLLTVQDELGHTDPKTTRIYAKTTDAQRDIDAEKLADFINMRYD